MVPAGNKAKRLLSVNHTTKTILHHHHHHHLLSGWCSAWWYVWCCSRVYLILSESLFIDSISLRRVYTTLPHFLSPVLNKAVDIDSHGSFNSFIKFVLQQFTGFFPSKLASLTCSVKWEKCDFTGWNISQQKDVEGRHDIFDNFYFKLIFM